MLKDANMEIRIYPNVINIIVHLLNKGPFKALDGMTYQEVWT